MQENQPPLQTLQDIRRMMERSSRFISLSGWSGVSAGICALAGAAAAYWRIGRFNLENIDEYSGRGADLISLSSYHLLTDLVLIAVLVFAAAFLSAFFFTWQRSKKNNTPIWDSVTRRLMWNTVIPMLVGGVCILKLLQGGMFELVGPFSLIFYGLALLNASKYTLGEIRYLAFGNLILGVINLWMTNHSLLFWALGFGVLHIVYGAMMWWKYER